MNALDFHDTPQAAPKGLSAGTDHGRVPAQAASLEASLILRDGSVVLVRLIRDDDLDRLRTFHASLSVDSIVFRFFRFLPQLPSDLAARFTQID
jgi:hypothetical protein